jgi:hypothetical protein
METQQGNTELNPAMETKLNPAMETKEEGRASAAMSRVGRKMEEVAEGLRARAPEEGRVHDVAEGLARRVEDAGHYLEESDLKGLAGDLTGVIRRHPLQSVLVGMGVGYLVGRRRRS